MRQTFFRQSLAVAFGGAFLLSSGPLDRLGVPDWQSQVDIAKCKNCHDDGLHAGKVIPRLSLHGADRNEEPALCVVCHNPDQTGRSPELPKVPHRRVLGLGFVDVDPDNDLRILPRHR